MTHAFINVDPRETKYFINDTFVETLSFPYRDSCLSKVWWQKGDLYLLIFQIIFKKTNDFILTFS